MYDSVKIVRFKDGLDVITTRTTLTKDLIELDNPMMFELRNSHLVLEQWLPIPVMEGDTVTIDSKEILCEMNPNSEFAEYYVETIRKLKRALRQEEDEPRDEDGMREMLAALIELETANNVVIH
jgi:hypothetical protein